MDNDIFKTKKFWEMYVNFSIVKEISNCQIGENVKDEDITERYSNIVFSQLVPITNNMIDFGLDKSVVESIVLPIIKKYNINDELATTIFSVIDLTKKENIDKNKIDNESNKNNIIGEPE